MMTIYGETNLHTDNAVLTDLIATRGMSGMMNTIWLILCAMCFGGAMTASGMLGSITSIFVRFMKNTVSVVAATVCSGLFLNLATADQYISIILTGNMFRDIYAKKGYESCLLSRTTEDAVTVTSVLIPWNSCGMTQATILSVPTLVYLPYCFFNIISPLMSIAVAAIGYKIMQDVREQSGIHFVFAINEQHIKPKQKKVMKKFIALVALVLVSASTMMYAQRNAAARRAERKAQRDAERANSVPKKKCRTWQPINKLYRL